MTTVECTKCHAPIVYIWGKWRHDTAGNERGCRAASFVENVGHNEDLPKSWVATAPRGTVRPATEKVAADEWVETKAKRHGFAETLRNSGLVIEAGKDLESGDVVDTSAGGVAIYHVMYANENFEQTAQILVKLIARAQEQRPNRSRMLFVEIDGHRNAAGGFDRDALEIIKDFGLSQIMPYVTDFVTPLMHVQNPKSQRNDVPETLTIITKDESK